MPELNDVTYDLEYNKFINIFVKHKNKPLKTLYYMYKDNLLDLFLCFVFFMIKASPVWILPVVTTNIINIATTPAKYSINELWINIGVAFVSIIQNVPMNVFYVKYYSKAARSVEARLRSALVRKLQQLTISFHKELKSGRIQSKVLRDVEAIEGLASQFVYMLLPVVINIIVALSVTIVKNIIVAVFFLFTVPFAVGLIYIFRKRMKNQNSDFRKEIEQMSSQLSEMVEMIPVTRAHALEQVEINKIDNRLGTVKIKARALDKLNALFTASAWVTMQLFQLACLAFTGYMAFIKKISIGEIFLYQTYFNILMGQISSLISIYPTITKGIESINSVGEILWADDIEEYNGKQKISDIRGEFVFKNVSFRYTDNEPWVLKNFNFTVKPGECIAFAGESGGGKSTLISLIVGFIKPTEGSIILDGQDMSEIDLRSFRDLIAVVPQNPILFSGSIKDNITYGLDNVSHEKLMEVIEAANLKELIDSLPEGIDTKIGEHGGRLSGGQRQRITIARAMIRDPKVVILDEATSALDNVSERKVQSAIKNMSKGRTTFIVAHRLSTIRDADRIAVIHQGTCTECGTYDELMQQNGIFHNMAE